MKGSLSERPLIEILSEIRAKRMGGALRLVRERVKYLAVFGGGMLVQVASNLKSHRLIFSMFRHGLINPDAVAGISPDLSDTQITAMLVSAKLIDEELLQRARIVLAEEILQPALLWTDGEWAYDPVLRPDSASNLRLDLGHLMSGAWNSFPEQIAESRINDANELFTARDIDWTTLDLSFHEAFILTRLDRPMRLRELIALGGDERQKTICSIYSLLLRGCLDREHIVQLFDETTVDRSRLTDSSQTRQFATSQADSASRSSSTPQAAAEPTPEEETEARRGEAETYLARMAAATNYYEVLDIGRKADVAAIKKAYLQIARSFHPDKFRRNFDPAVYSKIESEFARVAQAYDCLSDNDQRRNYDLKLQRSAPSSADSSKGATSGTPAGGRRPAEGVQNKPKAARSESELASEAFSNGIFAFEHGNAEAATGFFGEAVNFRPKDAKYRSWFAKALSQDPRNRRQAENEFKVAISLDKRNVEYYVMLSELYLEIGFAIKAKTVLEQALSIEPSNKAVRIALAKLKARPTSE